jgi:hypothetical protein
VLQGIGLISVWLGPSNGLNVSAACLVHYGNLMRDCSGNQLAKLVFRPLFGLVYCYLSCMFSRSDLLNVAIGFFLPILKGTQRTDLIQ